MQREKVRDVKDKHLQHFISQTALLKLAFIFTNLSRGKQIAFKKKVFLEGFLFLHFFLTVQDEQTQPAHSYDDKIAKAI